MINLNPQKNLLRNNRQIIHLLHLLKKSLLITPVICVRTYKHLFNFIVKLRQKLLFLRVLLMLFLFVFIVFFCLRNCYVPWLENTVVGCSVSGLFKDFIQVIYSYNLKLKIRLTFAAVKKFLSECNTFFNFTLSRFQEFVHGLIDKCSWA